AAVGRAGRAARADRGGAALRAEGRPIRTARSALPLRSQRLSHRADHQDAGAAGRAERARVAPAARPGDASDASGVSAMRWSAAIVLSVLLASASAHDARPKPADVGVTIDRGLGFLVRDALAWKSEASSPSTSRARPAGEGRRRAADRRAGAAREG